MLKVLAVAAALQPSSHDTGFWYSSMDHTGQASGRAAGLDGDAHQVYLAATCCNASTIQAAISYDQSGERKQGWLASRPRVVYIPPGVYETDKAIVMQTDTILMGDATQLRQPPIIKASKSFKDGVLISGIDASTGEKGENSFAIGLKNIMIDTTAFSPNENFTALYWGVAQASQLQNVKIQMPKPKPKLKQGRGHSGIVLGRGSTLAIADVRIQGGQNGIWHNGHQQALYKNIYFHENAVGMLITGGNTISLLSPTFDSVQTGIQNTGGSPFIGIVGGNSTNSGITVASNVSPSIVIQNLQTDRTSDVVQLGGSVVLAASGQVDNFSFGNTVDRDPVYGATVGAIKLSESAAPGGRIPSMEVPNFADKPVGDFINVKDPKQNGNHKVRGDGTGDEADVLNKILEYAVEQNKIAYFPFGDYRVQSTLFVPIGSQIVGEAWSTISASGKLFADALNPRPVVQVGKENDTGTTQIQDMRFTVAEVLPGAILVQFQAAGSEPGQVALFNSLITVGGTSGTPKLTDACQDASNPCKAAFMGLHLSKHSSVYVENVWNWVADHMTERTTTDSDGCSIAGKVGTLVESTKGTWLHALGSEHWWLSQLSLKGAAHVVVTLLQTETNYEQGDKAKMLLPEPWQPMSDWGDPEFAWCKALDGRCRMGLANYIKGGADIAYYGSASWAFFSGPGFQECAGQFQCQKVMHWIEETPKNLQLYGMCTKDTATALRLGDGTMIQAEAAAKMKWSATLFAGLATLRVNAQRPLSEEAWTVTNEHQNITLAGSFPSQVHLDLYAANLIEDPYHGLNDINLRWISAQNWTYTSKPISGLQKDNDLVTWIVFDGLDTYTTIKFCDKIVATTDNQFKQWSVDVSSALADCKDDPVLSINFGAVPPIINKLNASGIETWPPDVVYPFEYPNRQWVRKEQSDFGWDWGPAFVPTGPWRDGRIVQLRDGEAYSLNTNIDIYRKGQVNNIAPDQGQPWVVNASLDYLGNLPQQGSLEAIISDALDPSKILYSGELNNVTNSNGTITGSVLIDGNKPELWWPRGMGHQPLYSIKVYFGSRDEDKPALASERRIGFRTILLSVGNVTDEQIARGYQPGNNWHFEINGHEFYAKGANMIPPDAFWPRVTRESGRMSRMFDSAQAQNFNMLRIWSSGAYLPDFIYDMADERGILLWSEFEFSDSLYPDYPDFVQSVTDEISYNVRRINHHPSLACWVGGNEFENLLLPVAQGVDPERYPYYLGQYEHLFITVMFTIVAENSRSISYTPSSANNGWTKIDFTLPVPMVQRYDNKTKGELYSNTDYYNYNSTVAFDESHYPVGRFAVEFGFTSMPSLATWKEALDPDDLLFNSSVIQLRNHHYPPGGLYADNYVNGTKGLVEMTLAVERYYPTPNKHDSIANFSSWCQATQLFQADFYKSQIEFYRRGSAMPERQMGSLYWQLNDIWQAPSWAALEYSGRWKTLPYVVRHAYKNVISAPYFNQTSGDLEIWVTSDLWEPVRGNVSLTWVDLRGQPIANNAGIESSLTFDVAAINSTRILRTNVDDLELPDDKDSILLMTLSADGHLPNTGNTTHFTHENHFLPVWPKDAKIVDPGLRLTRDHDTKSFIVEATEGVALYTWLTHPEDVVGFFEDNAFVLVAGQKKQVGFTVQQDLSNGSWIDKVTVQSLWDLTTTTT